MKKILTYASATIMLAQLAACSKKDSSTSTPPTSNTSPIIATWQEVAYTSDRPIKVGDTTTTENLFLGIPTCQHYYATFKSNGTFNGVQVDCNNDSTWAISNTWKLNGSTLTLGANGGSGNVTILKLTADSLQWSGPGTFTTSLGDTVQFVGTETFKRI